MAFGDKMTFFQKVKKKQTDIDNYLHFYIIYTYAWTGRHVSRAACGNRRYDRRCHLEIAQWVPQFLVIWLQTYQTTVSCKLFFCRPPPFFSVNSPTIANLLLLSLPGKRRLRRVAKGDCEKKSPLKVNATFPKDRDWVNMGTNCLPFKETIEYAFVISTLDCCTFLLQWHRLAWQVRLWLQVKERPL